MKILPVRLLIVSVALMQFLIGCSGGSSSPTPNSQNPPTTPPVSGGSSGVAVDPYISGAIFYEDLNNNGVWDATEQVSTVSGINGKFTFNNTLTSGSTIIMKNYSSGAALHNGAPFYGKLKRKVDSSGELISSPSTTLLANGMTGQEIISLLTEAGLAGVTEADLTADPMSGIDTLSASAVTEANLKKIKSAMMIYAFMAIENGISRSGYDLRYADFDAGRRAHLRKMVILINTSLDPALFVRINNNISATAVQIGQALPLVTAGDVVRGAVAISDAVIKRTLDSRPLYNYDPSADPQLTVWCEKIGPQFYFLRNKDNTVISTGMNMGLLNSMLITSAATFRTYTTFYIDDTGAVKGR